MAKAYVVCIIFAKLADTVRISQDNSEQLVDFRMATETGAVEGRTGYYVEGQYIGSDQFVGSPLQWSQKWLLSKSITPNPPIPPIPPSAPSLPIAPILPRLPIRQSIYEDQFGNMRPWKKDTNAFILNEAVDALNEAKPEPEDIVLAALGASLSSVLPEAKNQHAGAEASQKEATTERPHIASISSVSISLGIALKHASVAYEALKQALGKCIGRVPLAARPDGQEKDHLVDVESQLKEALKRALEAYDSLKRDPTMCRDCIAIFHKMRQQVEIAQSYDVAGACEQVMVALNPKLKELQRVLDQFQAIEGKVVALTAEKTELTLTAYESLKWQTIEIMTKMHQSLGAAQSNDVVKAYDKMMETLNHKRANIHRVLDQQLELEDKLIALNIEKNNLAILSLRHAAETSELLTPPSLNSSDSKAEDQRLDVQSSREEASRAHPGIVTISSVKRPRPLKHILEASESLKHALEYGFEAYLDFLSDFDRMVSLSKHDAPSRDSASGQLSWLPQAREDFSLCDQFFQGPYCAILDFLVQNRLLEDLPVDAKGVITVSVPFCGSLVEVGPLTRWLENQLLRQGKARAVSILATDIINDESFHWAERMDWVFQNFPGVKLELRRVDLSKAVLPIVGLTLAIHPAVHNKNGSWHEIIRSVLSSAHGGLCVFATFFESEMQAIVGMCLENSVECQAFSNPYYHGREVTSWPWMRYIIIALPGRLGPPLLGHEGSLAVQPLFTKNSPYRRG